MNFWFCNQSNSWHVERANNVVCASGERGVLKYRSTVGMVKAGDIIVHYGGFQQGYVAVSQALEDGQQYEDLPLLVGKEDDPYGFGWRFRTRYYDFDPAIPRREVAERIGFLTIPDGPYAVTGHVKEGGYLFHFSQDGLEAIRSLYRGKWPIPDEAETSERALAQDDELAEEFFEGERRSAFATVRSDRLREDAKKKYGVNCYCCGFSFERFYGIAAKGKAIVHHLTTFRSPGGGSRHSTVEDVRVVCANCHYMVHLEDPPLDLDKLRQSLSAKWTLWSNGGVERKMDIPKR